MFRTQTSVDKSLALVEADKKERDKIINMVFDNYRREDCINACEAYNQRFLARGGERGMCLVISFYLNMRLR